MQKRLKLCANGLEYKLSLDTPNVSIALKTRLAKPMPVVTHYEPTQPFEKLEQAVTNHNFVIHNASETAEFPVHQIENMTFLVTFLEKNGELNKERTRIWVSGNVLNGLVCQKLKKYKFVYDETVVGKTWMVGKTVIVWTLSVVALNIK